jgi:hypothetical protein
MVDETTTGSTLDDPLVDALVAVTFHSLTALAASTTTALEAVTVPAVALISASWAAVRAATA